MALIWMLAAFGSKSRVGGTDDEWQTNKIIYLLVLHITIVFVFPQSLLFLHMLPISIPKQNYFFKHSALPQQWIHLRTKKYGWMTYIYFLSLIKIINQWTFIQRQLHFKVIFKHNAVICRHKLYTLKRMLKQNTSINI